MNNALDIAAQSIQQADFTTVQQYAKLLQQYVNSRIKQDKPQVGDVNLFSNEGEFINFRLSLQNVFIFFSYFFRKLISPFTDFMNF